LSAAPASADPRPFRSKAALLASAAAALFAGEALAQSGSAPAAELLGEGGFYVSPVWLALLIPAVGGWLYLTSWLADDAMGIGMRYRNWTTAFTAAGLVGFALALLVHPALVFVMAVGITGLFGGYVRIRNARVPADFQILTKIPGMATGKAPPKRGPTPAPSAAAGPAVRTAPAAAAAPQQPHVEVNLTNQAGKTLADLLASEPAFEEAAGVLGDLIARACAAQAMGLRIEPGEEQFAVLFKLDDMMHPVDTLAPELGPPVIACLARFFHLGGKGKAAGSGTVRLPGGREVALKVRGVKSKAGPAVVISLPDWHKDIYKGGLGVLGMHPAMAQRLEKLIAAANTTILISGPPRSGRTSTFHAALSLIDIFTTDVTTLETRPEHELDQVQRHEVNVGSLEAVQKLLPSILREEPDVIGADELIAPRVAAPLLEFAADGRRLQATTESGSAAEAVEKILHGVQPQLLSRTLACVLNQRLIRKLCEECKEPIEPNPQLLAKLKINPSNPGTWFRPVGCEQCLGAGYSGRTALYEMLIASDAVRKLITAGKASAAAIRKVAGEKGIRTLYQDALLKIQQGVTSLQEVRRVLKK